MLFIYFYFLYFISNQKEYSLISQCDDYTKYATIPCITMTWQGVHPAMSPQVPCKSKGQHLFSLLVFISCSSGQEIVLDGVVIAQQLQVHCDEMWWGNRRCACVYGTHNREEPKKRAQPRFESPTPRREDQSDPAAPAFSL